MLLYHYCLLTLKRNDSDTTLKPRVGNDFLPGKVQGTLNWSGHRFSLHAQGLSAMSKHLAAIRKVASVALSYIL